MPKNSAGWPGLRYGAENSSATQSRTVRSVGGQVTEERLVFLLLLAHPLHGLAEPEVGAIALELLATRLYRGSGR